MKKTKAGSLVVASLFGLIVYYIKSQTNTINQVTDSSLNEPMFRGVSLKKLDEIAKSTYHGVKCALDNSGYLIYYYKSNRGHQTYSTQLELHDNKLYDLWNSGYDSVHEFIKKANVLFANNR